MLLTNARKSIHFPHLLLWNDASAAAKYNGKCEVWISTMCADAVGFRIPFSPNSIYTFIVSAMPTFLFIKGGEVVDRLMGANPDQLQQLIEDNM